MGGNPRGERQLAWSRVSGQTHAGVPKGEQIPKNVLKIVITLLNFITAGTDLKIKKKKKENNEKTQQAAL